MKSLVKNIIKDLNLSFYKFDDDNSRFIPHKNFGSVLTKEYVTISLLLIENNIEFEITEDSVIRIL